MSPGGLGGPGGHVQAGEGRAPVEGGDQDAHQGEGWLQGQEAP